jgi:hypothetical protein
VKKCFCEYKKGRVCGNVALLHQLA